MSLDIFSCVFLGKISQWFSIIIHSNFIAIFFGYIENWTNQLTMMRKWFAFENQCTFLRTKAIPELDKGVYATMEKEPLREKGAAEYGKGSREQQKPRFIARIWSSWSHQKIWCIRIVFLSTSYALRSFYIHNLFIHMNEHKLLYLDARGIRRTRSALKGIGEGKGSRPAIWRTECVPTLYMRQSR